MITSETSSTARALLASIALLTLVAVQGIAAPAVKTSGAYVVFAWNDLGMHCLNPSYDTAVILPPYNTVWAQVVQRGTPPKIVTAGLTVSYKLTNNTYSYGKRLYGQFWDNVKKLFGVSIAGDTGLNLEDPAIHNGLSGTMVAKTGHFQANGIPVVPVDDKGTWNPYQVIEVTVKDAAGTVVASSRTTIPTSDEINCSKCHGADAFNAILTVHDKNIGTSLSSSKPVLCASCHGTPALGSKDAGSVGLYLSKAIHGYHADKGASCYDCHPGTLTTCNRSVAHTAADGNCVACHGTLQQVAASIPATRIPWVNEPRCASCHAGIAGVDTSAVLYRNASGHGGVSCAACHGSPHAMLPSLKESDNFQAIAYQGKAVTIGDCRVCHRTSQGEGAGEFAEAHGSGGRTNACYVCHTGFKNPSSTASWPHAFQWKKR